MKCICFTFTSRLHLQLHHHLYLLAIRTPRNGAWWFTSWLTATQTYTTRYLKCTPQLSIFIRYPLEDIITHPPSSLHILMDVCCQTGLWPFVLCVNLQLVTRHIQGLNQSVPSEHSVHPSAAHNYR